jgi:hypothetical protein
MGVVFTLEIDGRSVTVPDPSGGECNAAGDFDRLLPPRADSPTLHRIGEYGEMKFTPSDMACIVEEAEGLLDAAKDGPERRGLPRRQALAARGSEVPDSILRARGE